jgi:hypothetical protein
LVTGERGVQFIFGFLLGKVIGALVSTFPLIGLYLEDANIRGLVMDEFVNYLLEFNVYHYALAIICGLIIVIWKSDDLFE